MPVTRLNLPTQLPHQDFVTSLAEELTHPQPEGVLDAPNIIEEPVSQGDRFYVTVIWDAWAEVPPQERGKIILDAYRQTQAIDPASISVAMGLTSFEARRLGVIKNDAA